MRSLGWLAHLTSCICLVVLFLYRGTVPTVQLDLAVQWLLVAVLVVSACICRPRFAVAASLVALVSWSWIEYQAATWTEWLPGHLVRLIVAMGLVTCLLRLRKQLATAERLARVDSSASGGWADRIPTVAR